MTASATIGTETVLGREFDSLEYARTELPMLTDWGAADLSETVHSLGMNWLTGLGRQHGRWAVSEYPVLVSGGEPAFVRPDAVWWTRPERQVELIAEFERYEPGLGKRSVVAQKVRHLLLAHRELGPGPRVLLLVAWAVSGTSFRGLDELRELAHVGFKSAGAWVPGVGAESRFVLATAIFAESQGLLRLREVLR